MAYGTIEYARARADEWRDTFLMAAVSAVQRLGAPLGVELSQTQALGHLETWYLGQDVQKVEAATKSLNESSQRLEAQTKRLVRLTQVLMGLTGILAVLSVIQIVR